MKAFIALLASVALVPNVASARQPVLEAASEAVLITTCAVTGDASSLTTSFTLTSASAIGGIAGGVIAGITVTPSSKGDLPTVTAMAIKTKGAGSNDRAAHAIKTKGAGGVDRSAHAINTKGCGAQAHTAEIDSSRAAAPVACAISDDGMSVSVSGLSVPASSQVSVQNLSFVSSSDAKFFAAGPGGGPRVLARCSGADGAPSNVAMLLLPAVQK